MSEEVLYSFYQNLLIEIEDTKYSVKILILEIVHHSTLQNNSSVAAFFRPCILCYYPRHL